MLTLKRNFSAQVLDLTNRAVPTGATVEGLTKALDLALAKVPADQQESLTAAIKSIFGEPLTLGAAGSMALTSPIQSEGALPAGEALKRMALALKIHAGGEVEITTAERDLIKERISKYYLGAIVPGRCEMLLEAEPARSDEIHRGLPPSLAVAAE